MSLYKLFIAVTISSQIRCPRNIQIEKGDNKTISCNFVEKQLHSLYWYKGNTASSGPILQIENGQPGGSKLGEGHYMMTRSGAMTIINTTVEQEGVYSVLVYFTEEDLESTTIIINVTVTPSPPCPKINVCDSCEECSKATVTISNLTCRINFSRPKIPVEWVVVSKTGISLTMDPPVIQKDDSTNTWKSSVRLSYEPSSCNQKAILQCVAQDDSHILEYAVSSVILYTGNCSGKNTTDTNLLLHGRVAIYVVYPIAIIAAVVICFICCILIYRNCGPNGTEKNMTAESQSLLSSENECDDEGKHLKSYLENFYKSMKYAAVLPWVEVPFDAFYTSCECIVIDGNGTKMPVKSDNLFSNDHIQKIIRKNQTVLINGNCAFGRTMLAKGLLQQWAREKKHDFIFIYLPLEGTQPNTRILDILKQEMNLTKYSDDKIKRIIEQYKCLIMLDGLDKINLASKQWISSELEETATSGPSSLSPVKHSDANFTVKDVLNQFRKGTYPKLGVWATTQDMNQTYPWFSKLVSPVEIKGYLKEQVEECVSTICSFYVNLKHISDNFCIELLKPKASKRMSGEEHTAEESNCNRDFFKATEVSNLSCDNSKNKIKQGAGTSGIYRERIKHITSQVHEFLEDQCIYDEFKVDPYILLLVIHIVSAKASDVLWQLREVQINNISKLMHLVVTCLEQTYIQIQGKHSPPPEEFQTIKLKLGEMAYNRMFSKSAGHLPPSVYKHPDESCALAIGLLKEDLRKDKKGDVSCPELLFRHELLKDYLTAVYIDQDSTYFDELMATLKKEKNDPYVGVLKFISCNGYQLNRFYNDLMELEMYNNVIDCIHRRKDFDKTHGILSKFCTREVYLARLENKQHQNAVRTFCKLCKRQDVKRFNVVSFHYQIKLHKLYFQQSCPKEFWKSLDLPKVETLGFVCNNFSDEEFISVLIFFGENAVTSKLSFVDCNIPVELSESTIHSLKQRIGTNMRVQRKTDQVDPSPCELDYYTGKWSTVYL
ncbi:hypothetical protein HOLleu_22584 [Holothuria leucospilota]|uniref:Ig-like domain-containing protein n=1 Tax=Holothuria leucospilota TaxID=206669 RepID=A0A9Q1BZB9_HOLLE|nr:hypothetical protein HOLleu_22584 [Holothuria leucospilota]